MTARSFGHAYDGMREEAAVTWIETRCDERVDRHGDRVFHPAKRVAELRVGRAAPRVEQPEGCLVRDDHAEVRREPVLHLLAWSSRRRA